MAIAVGLLLELKTGEFYEILLDAFCGPQLMMIWKNSNYMNYKKNLRIL